MYGTIVGFSVYHLLFVNWYLDFKISRSACAITTVYVDCQVELIYHNDTYIVQYVINNKYLYEYINA
jgi:hypothetical protein